MAEILNQRSYTRKVFDLDNGQKRYNFHIAHKHFKDGQGAFLDINQDLQYNDLAKVWYNSRASYHPILPEYADDWFEFYNNYEGANHTIKAKPVAGHIKGEYFKAEDGNGVLYKDAFGKGIDLKVYAYWAGLKKVIVINEKPADTSKALTFDFEMDLPKDTNGKEKVKDRQGVSWDKSSVLDFTSKTLKIGDTGKESYFCDARVWDSKQLNKKVQIDLFVKNGKTYLRKTITPNILEKAVYPLMTDHPTSYYAGAGDGYVECYIARQDTYNNVWDTAHDNTGIGDYGDYSSGYENNNLSLGIGGWADTPNWYEVDIFRFFFPIDTSGIADSDTIDSATFYVYEGYEEVDFSDSYSWWNIIGSTTQGDVSALTAEDFDNCGAVDNPTEYCDTRNTITNTSPIDSYVSFAFNSAGKNAINKTGYTKLGAREGHDCSDVAPDNTDFLSYPYNKIRLYFSNDPSGTKDPYLDVTVSAGGTTWVPKVYII